MRKRKIIVGFIAAGLFALALTFAASKNLIPYISSDTTAYIEAAQNLRIGKGLVVASFGIIPIDKDSEPLRWWPPGYSLVISAISSFHIEERTAATFITIFLFLLLPLAFFLVLRFFLNDTVAFASAVIITFMWPTVALSIQALSDTLFLFISLISFYLLFKALAGDQLRYGFMAGLCVAFAIATRHVGYILLFGMTTGLFLALSLRTISREKYFRLQITYFFGFALGYLPLFLRNIFVLGTLQPYHIQPVPTPPTAPFIKLLEELACIFVGIWPSHGVYLVGLILLLAPTIYYLAHTGIREYYRNQPLKATYLLILSSYLFIAALLFTVIGPRYLWKDEIEYRLLIPHYWIIAVFLILALIFCCQRLEHSFKIKQRWTILIILTIFFAAQFHTLGVWIERQKPQSNAFIYLGNSSRLINTIKALPENTYIISNCGPYLRLFTGRDVRKLSRININFSPQGLANLVCPTRPLYVILVYLPQIREILPESWRSIDPKTIPAGYQCVSNDGTIIVLRHEKPV